MDSKNLLRKIAAEHHTPAVHVNRRDGKQCLCPHCGKELTAKDIYKDIKGWEFCRSCFRKGKGSIKRSYASELIYKLADFGGGGDAAAQGQSATTPPLPTEGDGSASTGGEDAAGMVDLHDPEKLDTDVFDLSAIKKAVLFDGMSDGTEDNQIANDDTGVEYSRRARRYSTDWRQHFMNLTQTPPYQESSAAGAQGKTLAPTGAGEPQSSQTPAMSGQDDGTGTHMQLDSSTMNFGPTRHMNA